MIILVIEILIIIKSKAEHYTIKLIIKLKLLLILYIVQVSSRIRGCVWLFPLV